MRSPFLFAPALLLVAPAWAEQRIVTTTITTEPPGASFKVDGTIFRGPSNFSWPEGSKHLLEFHLRRDGYQYEDHELSRFTFGGWSESSGKLVTGASPLLTITADAGIREYKAQVYAEHRVFVVFYGEVSETPTWEDSPPVCGTPGDIPPAEFRPGVVWVNGQCYWNSVRIWLPHGSYILNAFPYPGFVFKGWVIDASLAGSYLRSVDVRGPMSVRATFAPARRVKFLTQPRGLQVMVDGAPVGTPEFPPCEENLLLPVTTPRGVPPLCIGEFDWGLGEVHGIGAPSPQRDRGARQWVFDGWTRGMAPNASYRVTELNPPETLEARFLRGVAVSFQTRPAGLRLNIDGREDWSSYNFLWGAGSRHRVTALAEQADARGRKCVFKEWSNGAAASQEIIPPLDSAEPGGVLLVAQYEMLSRTRIETSPAGLTVRVDGAECRAPCIVDRKSGSSIRVAADAAIPVGEGRRLEFVSWSDGGARERTLNLSGVEVQTITVNYRSAWRLETASDPPGGARVLLESQSADGFYPDGAQVQVRVEPRPGYRFRQWGGDLEGNEPVAVVAMTGPRRVRAILDPAPYIATNGVRNAATGAPGAGVAAGSLISVFGLNLAPVPEAGPTDRLRTAIGGVSLRIGERALGLLFVSPDQINAQLPGDLESGTHTLVLQNIGEPETSREFVVVRNAPGLFSRPAGEMPMAIAVHEDGSPVTGQAPARSGELLTIYGTGFGPLETVAADTLETGRLAVADPVEILAGDQRLETVWAGPVSGQVGMIAVRFRVTQQSVQGRLAIKARANGAESNVVLLPVE